MNVSSHQPDYSKIQIALVIPTFRVKNHILDVIKNIPGLVSKIYVVDDACPEGSGQFVAENIEDSRVKVFFHDENQGVGGAVATGYKAALKEGAEIIVKIDGDGQMDPQLVGDFILPIVSGEADYTKGNRFYNLEEITAMPKVRLFGNAMLSLMAKVSSGYWNLFDPTNGYTAIHADIVRKLPFDKISRRYFFETDMLFRLNTLRAVVVDVPMDAKYGDEDSSLKISRVIFEFFVKHMRNAVKRVFYNYYLRDMSLASMELPLGLALIIFGASYGLVNWADSAQHNISTPPGTVMLSALPLLVGIQLVLAFVGYDVASVPRRPIHRGNVKRLDSNTGVGD